MINRVLFYNSGGGIGDAIQILPLIYSLKNKLKNVDFFYLGAHENHFIGSLKNLNFNIKTLDLNIKYFGFRLWHFFLIKKKIKENDIKKFDLIIDLQSKLRNTIILKRIPHKYFISSCLNFKLSKPKLNIPKTGSLNSIILNAVNKVLNTNVDLIDFNINDIESKFFEESKKLLPKNNYVGLSITQGNVYRKKEWPLKNIISFCKVLIEKNKVPVFFIEKKNVLLKNKIKKLIPNALFPEHNLTKSCHALVTALALRLEKAISIDNGVMHMMSLANIPLIVLFGPTNANKFAPRANNVKILDSNYLYKSNDISKISVEEVFKYI